MSKGSTDDSVSVLMQGVLNGAYFVNDETGQAVGAQGATAGIWVFDQSEIQNLVMVIPNTQLAGNPDSGFSYDDATGVIRKTDGNSFTADDPGLPTITFSAMAVDPTGSTTAATETFTMKFKIDADRFDPLILDIDGDGVDFISVAADGTNSVDITYEGIGVTASSGMFPLNVSPASIQSSWIDASADDYFLVKGSTLGDSTTYELLTEFYEISEGQSAGSGFSALAYLDSNADQVLEGAELNDLRLWKDSGNRGVIDNSELSLLSDEGIDIAKIHLHTSYMYEVPTSFKQFYKQNTWTSFRFFFRYLR